MVRPGEVADRPAERMPFGWAALAAVIAVCAGPTAAAQTASTTSSAPPAPATATATATENKVLLEADQLIDDQVARTITAQGDVQVRYEGRTMRADQVVYDLDAGTIHATGDVEMVMEDGSVTYADEVETDDSMNIAVATELRAHLGRSGTLAARAALRHGEGQSELRNIIFTSCPICEGGNRPPTWSLRARRAIQNHETRTITYEGAVLDVAGVPVLYLPYFGHPDPTVGRASGFLTPDVGRNSRLGAFYDQPYYWAISPSQDLTASLRVHENVNPLLGLDYRKRFFSGRMNLETTFTQEQLFDTEGQRLGDDRFRWSAFGDGRFHINNYWDWGFGLEHTYDDFYLRRYDLEQITAQDRGPYIGTRTRLTSQLYAIGQDSDSYSQIAFVNFQGLRATDTSDLLPLILPFAETDHVYQDPWLNGQLRLKANTAVLVRNDDSVSTLGNDARFTTSADWRKDMIVGPGLVFSPFAQARGDFYDIETTPDHYETVTRGLGLAGAQISWPFMRPGQNFDMIVEPIVMAAYASENADDPRIVNEDSLGFELDESDLFRPNGAPNYDLWEPGGRVAVGVRATARTHSGESASLIFGRRFRSEADPQFTTAENLAGKASDYVAGVETDLGHVFGASASIRLDDEDLNVQRLDLGVRAAAGRFTFSARYFNLKDSIYTTTPNEELTANVGVDLVRGWRAQFGLTRDLDSDINLRQEIAAIYEDDCTFLEITYSRSDTTAGTIGPDEGIQIRVGLRSLGVFGGS